MKVMWLLKTSVLLLLAAVGTAAQTVTVVDVIPQSNSNEANDDSEPNIAVNPANPLQIAATAFTPDSSGATNLVPIFLSADGGQTWTESSIIPVAANNNCPATCDITLRFAGASNILYVSWLDGFIPFFGSPSIEYNVLRTTPFPGPPVVTVLENIAETSSFRDQPFIQATTVIGGPSGVGDDRIYVGSNDGSNAPKTSTIDQSLDAATAPPPAGLAAVRPELRTTCGFDGPPVRPFMHPDGTVYAAFSSWTACSSAGTTTTANTVLVRDDNWGSSSPSYSAITDTSDSIAGVLVASGISIPFNPQVGYADLGTERIGSPLSIAIDPRNSQIVYVAWGTGSAPANFTLNVARSSSGGTSGSWTNLLSITGATNPALAVTIQGTVGFLYQQLVKPGTCNAKGSATSCFETHLQTSTNFGNTWTTNLTLGNLPDVDATGISPSIGDYDHLLAIGKDFYGIFSGYNAYATPTTTNFPQGISFQRFTDGAGNYYADAGHHTSVVNTVDPFFFHVAEEAPGDDFYVRDWTASPTSGDNGVEPSTNPVFYATSDVWNRRGTLDGSPFPNDQPANEDAGNGAGAIGDNWAFARIRRNTGGAAATVTAHFLVSKFGTGSNFVDNTSLDPDVTLDPGDPTLSFVAGDTGPHNTSAYHWHLGAIAGNHLCLAVEISTPNDPYTPPSLVGSTPGWGTGTDTRIVDDNNKAQRNMGLTTTPARGAGMIASFCAIAHNAATFPRNMTLSYETSPEVMRSLKGFSVELIGQQKEPSTIRELSGALTLEGMQPGENRWLCTNFAAPPGKEGEILPINFYEMVKNIPVNGFAVGLRLASMGEVARDNLELHRSAFTRMSALFKIGVAKEEAAAAEALLRQKNPSENQYLDFLKAHLKPMEVAVAALIKSQKSSDPFGAQAAMTNLATAVNSGKIEDASVAHASLMNKLDSFQTMLQLAKGDPADILQMVRWQEDLYRTRAPLTHQNCSSQVVKESQEFISEWGSMKNKGDSYTNLLHKLSGCFKKTAEALERGHEDLEKAADGVEDASEHHHPLAAVEGAHQAYLTKLAAAAQ